jgi:beta-glucosidase
VNAQWKSTRRQLLTLASLGALTAACTEDRRLRPLVTSSPVRTPTPSTASQRVALPADLLLGLATSAYQIEGSVHADGRGPSIWDTFCARSGTIKDGSSGAISCDHYRRWSSDLDLMALFGLKSYRFSVAWPRVLPDGRGAVNQRGLDFYKRLVDGLLTRGISPMATLYHWDLPQALQDLGGWAERDGASWFADYARLVFDRLEGVERWLTINEPRIIVQYGHQRGQHAPGIADDRVAGRTLHHLGLAHGLAVQAFRSSKAKGSIGPCHVVTPCYPADDSSAAKRATAVADARLNTLYLDPMLTGQYPPSLAKLEDGLQQGIESAEKGNDLNVISETVDFVGVNYYTPAVIDAKGNRRDNFPVTPINWPIYPNGLTDVLNRLHREYNVRIAVTENGIAGLANETLSDSHRTAFLRDHLLALQRATDAGARVESFHAWSFLDNFEWAQGYTQRWGLFHVDFATQQRTPKHSGRWFADVIARHSVPVA